MVSVKLTIQQINLFTEIFADKSDMYQVENGRVVVDKTHLEQIVDIICDYFIKYGLDSHWEPTAFGLEIEYLQDKFLEEIYKLEM